MATPTLKEDPLNAYLAEIIGESHSLVADPEVSLSDGRMDVRCRVGSQVIGIEAKLGNDSVKRREAISDANRRLVNKQCDLAIALVYPPGAYRSADDLRNGEVRVNVRTKTFAYGDKHELALQAKKARWHTVSVRSLSDYLENAPGEASTPESLASMADVAIESANDAFTPDERAAILHVMGINAASDPAKAVKGLMTDLMTAIMFHSKLDVIRHSVDEPYRGWGPLRVIECINAPNIQAALKSAHEQWILIDYKQILEWSCAILDALPSTSSTRSALSRIARTARDIEQLSGGEHHDLFGITFCQSVESAKNDGSMYTTIAGATLLTRLAFNEIDGRIDWTDYDQVTGLRIVDFACGTGTLLIAAANYILTRERTGRHDEVARALLERVLYGFDINNRAIFQSATGFGMISPNVAFRNMHLYSMLLGIDPVSETARIGSLELLDGLDQGSFNRRPYGTRIDSPQAPIEVEGFDIAIMNPPFTVQDKRHHQFPESVKDALKDREKTLAKGTAIHRSGNSGAFVVLADKHLDDDAGLLAFVLPSISVNAPSARKLRLWLAERFHIKYLVVSYDPTRMYFSGKTDIGEMLVVAARKPALGEPPPTTAVKLIDNPKTASSAVASARYIIDGTADQHDYALMDSIPYADILDGNWRALQFVDPKLHSTAVALSREWHSTMGDQFEIKDIGAHVSIHGDKLNRQEAGATPVLWEHDAKYCNKLQVKPDYWVKPKPGHEADMRRHRHRLHRLKLPERLRLTSSCATALLTDVPSLGMAWQNAVPLNAGGHEGEDVEKTAAMILNSTLGKLAVLLVRNNKIPSYCHFSITAQRSIPLPSIASLTANQVRALVDTFDSLASIERKPFPDAHDCEVQQGIDAIVCEVLNFDLDECIELRERLAREPMISNQPYRHDPTQDVEVDIQRSLIG